MFFTLISGMNDGFPEKLLIGPFAIRDERV